MPYESMAVRKNTNSIKVINLILYLISFKSFLAVQCSVTSYCPVGHPGLLTSSLLFLLTVILSYEFMLGSSILIFLTADHALSLFQIQESISKISSSALAH